MLYDVVLSRSGVGETITDWIEYAALGIEIVAVVIIVVSILLSLLLYAYRRLRGELDDDPYDDLKGQLGRTMLLGLEILVAADIVRTVALDTTLESVAVLGLLVLVRTFLSWALDVELDGRWPWQASRDERPAD